MSVRHGLIDVTSADPTYWSRLVEELCWRYPLPRSGDLWFLAEVLERNARTGAGCTRSLYRDQALSISMAAGYHFSQVDVANAEHTLLCPVCALFSILDTLENVAEAYLGINTPGLHLSSSSPKNSVPKMYCNGFPSHLCWQ